jgi:ribosomal protein L6P/L9E
MVVGVSAGFEKRMEMVGTGYRASSSATELTLNVGYSKPRVLAIPDGISVKVGRDTAGSCRGAGACRERAGLTGGGCRQATCAGHLRRCVEVLAGASWC